MHACDFINHEGHEGKPVFASFVPLRGLCGLCLFRPGPHFLA